MLFTMTSRRAIFKVAVVFFTTLILFVFLRTDVGGDTVIRVLKASGGGGGGTADGSLPKPVYKPTPTYEPPPVRDPFPLLATSTPPPIPVWNRPRPGLHSEYELPVAPPLLIGFTRSWPILLQAVVSYITAGWPPSQIYVVENTGAQQANARGQLGLQNPFFLNHTALKKGLGVNVVQTPTLLTFAQLQNFYLALSYEREWPYYFWSHMDVLAFSYEDGAANVTEPYDAPEGYRTMYEVCCATLAEARRSDPRWGLRLFAYDHLSLVNPEAVADIGGWDTLIPYYMTDCDFYERMRMARWSVVETLAGVVTDINSALVDLLALYRDPSVPIDFVDPNPPPPEEGADEKSRKTKRTVEEAIKETEKRDDGQPVDKNVEFWRALRDTGDRMYHYKHSGDRGRNTWQVAQRGGFGEAYYYPPVGTAEGIEALTTAGREIFRLKWGHRDCDLRDAGLALWDQWRVEKDWKD